MQATEQKTHQPLLRNRSFRALWLASTCSFLALSTYLFAEQWYILRVLKLDAYLGLVLMLTLLPRIFLMVVGGVIADRFKKSIILRYSSLLRFTFVLLLLSVYHFELLTIVPLAVFAFLFGCIDAFFSPASSSLLPLLVSKEDLTRTNSILQTSNQMALFSGPLLGGVLLTFSSFHFIFLTISLFLLLASLGTFFIREHPVDNPTRTSAWLELAQGFHYVFADPYLKRILFLLIIINFFFFGPLLMGIPLLVDRVLLGQALDLSYLQGAYQLGMLLGAAWIGFSNLINQSFRLLLSLIGLLGVGLVSLGQIGHVWHGVLLLLTMGGISSIINVLILTTIQTTTRPQMMGRVMSLVNAASNGLVPLSYAMLSLTLSFEIRLEQILLFCGCGIVFVVCTAFVRIR
ncbi:multidrug ABC transporter permease [Exiguobacterium sp. KRL4]|uniref:MFS transporter n=1 Tax=Exiguobacterium sp. KRL4 TaxID=1914536 RepID=UPI0008F848A2|nr:MFS transporter [Exiguobacterium sp. KRL4]OIN66618.1 multidrug ABC transporter permease [Exiguobacterium sp. KRL4]